MIQLIRNLSGYHWVTNSKILYFCIKIDFYDLYGDFYKPRNAQIYSYIL